MWEGCDGRGTDIVELEGAKTRGNASAYVQVRFQRHDVLPYAFCFNFLEATGSISFVSTTPLFFFLSSLSPSLCVSPYPPSRLPPLLLVVPRGSSAKCTTVVFSTVDAARYILSSSPFYPSPFLPSPASPHPPTVGPTVPIVPTAPCLSLSFPSRSVYPFLATRSLMPPPLRHGEIGRAHV